MVALHLNHAVFDRAARPAGGFELFAQCRQRRSFQPQAAYHRHAFAAPPLGLAQHPQHPVRRSAAGRRQRPLVSRALALRHRLVAIGADAASFGGVDEGGGGAFQYDDPIKPLSDGGYDEGTEVICIISARKADPKERKRYDQENR